jgi:hypothetical protein
MKRQQTQSGAIRGQLSFKNLLVLTAPAFGVAMGASAIQAETALDVCQNEVEPLVGSTNNTLNCPCAVRFLNERFGAADADVIMQMIAVAASKSEKRRDAILARVGMARAQALAEAAGKLGNDMDKACAVPKAPSDPQEVGRPETRHQGDDDPQKGVDGR